MKIAIMIGLLIIAGFVLLFSGTRSTQPVEPAFEVPVFQKTDEWTLFVYKSETPDITEQKYVIEDYPSKRECIERGIDYTKLSGSFECGKGCRFETALNEQVCKQVCNRKGCR